MSRSKKVAWRNLGLGIKYFAVARKANSIPRYGAPNKVDPPSQAVGPSALAKSQVSGTVMPLFIGEASKVEQHVAFNAQGIAKRTPVAQILFYPPEHGI